MEPAQESSGKAMQSENGDSAARMPEVTQDYDPKEEKLEPQEPIENELVSGLDDETLDEANNAGSPVENQGPDEVAAAYTWFATNPLEKEPIDSVENGEDNTVSFNEGNAAPEVISEAEKNSEKTPQSEYHDQPSEDEKKVADEFYSESANHGDSTTGAVVPESPEQVDKEPQEVDKTNDMAASNLASCTTTVDSIKNGENVDCSLNDGNTENSIAAEAHVTEKPSSRNSLVGRVKTVGEDGDTASGEDEESATRSNDEDEDPWVIADSNLRDPQRRICVVTTAALPWMTGTAVNPLLRALYLTRGRPKHYVTLVIPWCQNEDDRNKTLGIQHSFANQKEQEDWIRDFCRTRANCEEEEKNLNILFYPSKYNESFGSIFPSVDICGVIPDEEADVAILEEPEHLNWLRVPKPWNEKGLNAHGGPKTEERAKGKRTASAKDMAELGWRFKFRHVVGIIHTNYKAYAEQYGVGTGFITAAALCALNGLVVRAYCHKVILLSGTLPSLTPYKEVICNVHGVRGEFLEPRANLTDESEASDEKHAPVYFIGKLIWAKGFDKILDLENLYREKHDDYFPIDVYGAGGDEKAIKRAFFGRIPQLQYSDSPKSLDEAKASIPDSVTAEIFTWETSLRSHLVEAVPFKEGEKHAILDDQIAKQRSSIIDPDDVDGLDFEQPSKTPDKRASLLENLADKVVPFSVLGNLSMSALDTTKEVSGAAVAVMKTVVGASLNVAFTNDVGSKDEKASPSVPPKQNLIFDPPKSIFEFRRNPIQARFLGTKDHVLLRDVWQHKVFLNMSTTEVLCTTSAEALAMGKFVILPKHPSNTFFLQFPNCLAYTSLEDCLEKLEWALANDPLPIGEEVANILSWEGANERLFDSAAVTRDEWEEWAETGRLKSDDDAARFHVDTGMKGQLIGKFFTRNKKTGEKS